MELFDLVNENDEVIGITNKDKSHADRELHRIVAIYVFDKDGKLYLQEHIKSGGKYDHSVGGHVKRGEMYVDAAKREALEELNITEELREIIIFYPQDRVLGKKGMHAIAFYEVCPSDAWKFVPNDEVKHIVAFPLEEIVLMINTTPEKFTTDFIRTMKKYIELKKFPLQINHSIFFSDV